MTSGMLRAVTGVGLATILYKGLAALQQLLLARALGATEAADAFFLAQVLPVLVGGLAYTALCSSTLYVMGGSGQPHDRGRLSAMLLQVAGFFAAAALLVYVADDWFIRLMAPASARSLVREATRIQALLLPVLLFQATGGMLAGILLSERRVWAPPLSMCLMYAGGLAGLWMTIDGRATRMAQALAAGSALQAFALLALLCKSRRFAKPVWRGTRAGLLASHALPALGCGAISTLFLVTDRSFAAGLGPGQVAAVSYVYSLITMPTQIIVNAVIGVCMPAWVGAGGNSAAFSDSLTRALSLLSFALLPIAIAMALGAEPVTRLALGAARFTPQQIDSTSELLALYCPALLGFAAKDALTAAAVAQGRSLAAFSIGLGSLAAAVAAKAALVPIYGLSAIAYGTFLSLALAVFGLLSLLAAAGGASAIPGQFWRRSKGALLSALPALAAGMIAARVLPDEPRSGWLVIAIALLAYAAIWLRLGGPASGLQSIRGRG